MRKALVNICVLLLFAACNEPESMILSRMDIMASVDYADVDRTKTNCTVAISEDNKTLYEGQATFHLRGNTTSGCPKRPFTVKLSEKTQLCGMPSAKSWVLLANYFDKTMLRNALAFRMGVDSRLVWTPRFKFVELYYNGVRKGTYQLCEKVQVNNNRLNLPTDGWLVEIDAKHAADDVFFTTEQIEQVIVFHEPEDTYLNEQMQVIATYFKEAEQALFSDDFTDSEKGWRHYLDEKSFIDWYLINEIARNNDAIFFTSCFMHSGLDGKICMGPLWDFDLGYGNSPYNESYQTKGWHVRKSKWYTRLFQDPSFMETVKKRFDYFYDRREMYYAYVRGQARELAPSAKNNETIWNTMNVSLLADIPVYGSYEKEVEGMIQWLEERFEWIKAEYGI